MNRTEHEFRPGGCPRCHRHYADTRRDRRAHEERHDAIENGLWACTAEEPGQRIGEVEDLLLDVYEVLPTAPRRDLRSVEAAAALANLDTRYDFGIFLRLEGDIAYVGVLDCRIVALAVVASGFSCWPARLDADGRRADLGAPIDDYRRLVLTHLWVLALQRRQGIARGLLRVVTGHLRTPIAEMGIHVPLTPAGAGFVRAVAAEQFIASSDLRRGACRGGSSPLSRR